MQKVRGRSIEAEMKISMVDFLLEKDERCRQTASCRETAIVELH